MPLESEPRVFRGHTRSVVAHSDARDSTALELDLDAVRSRVERVFDELFDDGRGPLDDFAGGDPVNDLARQAMDPGHEGSLLNLRLAGSLGPAAIDAYGRE